MLDIDALHSIVFNHALDTLEAGKETPWMHFHYMKLVEALSVIIEDSLHKQLDQNELAESDKPNLTLVVSNDGST